jgi:hypothetical protein
MLNNPIPGPNSAVEYQVSAIPWVTASLGNNGTVRFDFPYVTSFIVIKNVSAAATVQAGFTKNGVESGQNCFSLAHGESFTGDFRITCLFTSGTAYDVNILAGLTGIPSKFFPVLTASNGNPGIG